MKFNEFDLNEDLLKGIEKTGFSECMQVQEKTLQHTLQKKDVYVQSQTGSGKTAAFLITIFELFSRGELSHKRSLIIVPTRELAVQIEREAKEIGSFLPYRIGSIYGGVGYGEQMEMLKAGYEILIGTPGRLIDLAGSKKLDFQDISVLVIDEADRLFDMGFLPDIRKMLARMSSRQMTMLFSATLNTRVWQVSWEYMNEPVEILMNPEQLTVDEITQELYHVSRDEKTNLLLGILKKEKPENALIFCNTKNDVFELAQRLSHNGYPCRYIIGDLPQKERIRVIDQLKSGELKFLVATDVAARGLHVDELALVVNYDLPEDPENYVHRIGRTARAGNTGKAISLACERFVYGLEAIEKLIGAKIPVMPIEDGLLSEDASDGMYFNRHRDTDSRGTRDRSPSKSRRKAHLPGSRRTPENRRAPENRLAPENRRASRSGPTEKREETSSRSPAPSGSRSPTRSRPPSERRQQAPPANRSAERPGGGLTRDMDVEERLDYYRKKYGEDFALKENTQNGETAHEKAQKEAERNEGGFLKNLFRKKRN